MTNLEQRRWTAAAVVVSLSVAGLVNAAEEREAPLGPIVVRGTVTDESGEPVAGAKVWLLLRYALAGQEPWVVTAEADERGEYKLEVDPAWTAREASYAPRAVWCFAPGHALGVANANRQVDDAADEPVDVRLGPESEVTIKVLNSQGEPVAGAPLTSFYYLNGGYQPPPEAVIKSLALATDDSGQVALPFADPSKLYSVQFSLPKYGDQYLQLSRQPDAQTSHTFRFVRTGTLTLKVEGGEPANRAGIAASVVGDSYGPGAQGRAQLTTNDEGSATAETFAEGRYRIYCRGADLGRLRPRLPKEIIVRAGETTVATITLEPTVEVRGRVVAEGTDTPVAGATVSVQHGNAQSERVTTDAQGWYTAQVLAGPVRSYLNTIPKGFQDWSRVSTDNQPTEAAASDKPTRLPDLLLRETVKLAGRLVDQDDRPLENYRVMAYVGNRTQGGAATDPAGGFEFSLPSGQQAERYTAYSQEGNRARHPAEIVNEQPLLLRINTSGVPTNVEITTSPTPPDKLRPPTPPAAGGGDRPVIIVAENVMIAGGKMVDLFGAQEYLESFENPAALTAELLLTQGSLRGDNERYEEMRLWSSAMREIIGFRSVITNIVGSRVSGRYDSLQLGDRWPPEGTREVAGRVVNAAGEPAPGAQVVLVEPAPAGARFYYHALYLTDGSARRTDEDVIVNTDEEGRFVHQTAAGEFGFIVMHPDGFAMAGPDAAGADAEPIALQPWARVTARAVPDQAIKQHLSVSCRLRPSPGLGDVYARMNSPQGDVEHDFIAVPPGLKVGVQRNIEGESGISTSLNGASASVETKPGETVHVEFGPLTKTQRATAEAQLKQWGE
ncbi:Nickel uptake substrate-specific transmembrane region [Posidoniimonas corsicana]|uniref:Nickel uptake substrate-specific transmembrane region n=1 Tax=Posidoniimonas corsicana TaxID=1938618 RepID=A0A5C5V5W5_9BACT|nr:carboxypeptidase-like regulatory domain-containing protein [Posidoniimonas corsicana]TWT33460.1 Nickel uptake substrate-specific transmembrane region [Posidoniimonas corsicana]